MLILQETTIIYYNTACCTPDDSRQYKTEKTPFLRGELISYLIRLLPGIWFNEGNGDYYIIHVSLETRDLNVLPFYYFFFFFFISSSELKTNVRGRMAMARGRDHFSVGLREQKKIEREREKVKRRRKSSLRCVETTVARGSRESIFKVTLGRTFNVRRVTRYLILTLLRP